MTVELRPLGVTCNIACTYCYQAPQRDAHNFGRRYDLEAMKAAILREGGPFSMFGGEPLLVPERDLEHLWAWGLEQFGGNGIQTNGSLITDEHIRMFKAYKVHVGISIDGPGALNDARWAGTLERTRARTAASEAAIERLCAAGIPPSLIVTLSRRNAAAEHLPRMGDWMRRLDAAGVRSARLHLLEAEHDDVRRELALSDAENIDALSYFPALALPHLRFDVFEDMRRMLLGQDDNTTCVWNACDPYTTRAVQGVEGFGQRSNCGRTNKDGVDYVKASTPGFERYIALWATPQDHGGCQGCRFFLMCKGQCPGTAIDGDWRNRTEHCGVWKELYRRLEGELLNEGRQPLSVHPVREELEQALLEGWIRGENRSMHTLLSDRGWWSRPGTNGSSSGHGDAHGDHYDGH